MNCRLISSAFLFLAGCQLQTGEAHEVRCGIQPTVALLPKIIESSKDCPGCLLEKVKSVIPKCPNDESLQILGMYSGYQAGNMKEAIKFYEDLKANGRASVDQHADAGYIYRKIGRNQESLESFEAAVRSGADATLQYEYARQLKLLGRSSDAKIVLQKIVTSVRPVREDSAYQVIGDDAVFDEASMTLAEIYREAGEIDKAKNVYLDILSVYPDDPAALDGLKKLGP